MCTNTHAHDGEIERAHTQVSATSLTCCHALVQLDMRIPDTRVPLTRRAYQEGVLINLKIQYGKDEFGNKRYYVVPLTISVAGRWVLHSDIADWSFPHVGTRRFAAPSPAANGKSD